MNDKALLAAILADPDDDVPRLAYADWLEEHGEVDRATLIRVQIRLAQLEQPSSEHYALYTQANKLLERNWKVWAADLPQSLRHAIDYQRGFVGLLRLTALQVLKVSGRVWARHPIQEFVLHDVTGRLDQLFALPHLHRVRRLLLHQYGGPLTDSDLNSLASCPGLAGLKGLTILSSNGNSVADALARCPSLAGLTYLRVDDANLDDEGVALLVRSTNVRQLNRLDLGGGARISAAAARSIAQAPGLSALRMLLLTAGPIGDDGLAALANSPHLTGLQTLWLGAQGVGPEGVVALACSPYLHGLQALTLAGNAIGDERRPAPCDSPALGRLRTLELARCGAFTPTVEAALRQRFGKAPSL